jgi:hypothetical protein
MKVTKETPPSPWRILAGQFGSPVIWLLLAATAIAGALGELADAIAIGTTSGFAGSSRRSGDVVDPRLIPWMAFGGKGGAHA